MQVSVWHIKSYSSLLLYNSVLERRLLSALYKKVYVSYIIKDVLFGILISLLLKGDDIEYKSLKHVNINARKAYQQNKLVNKADYWEQNINAST